ncbi:MAG: type III pantothenate kinase [Provencibacterium sp.]|jgi:type III pantothenate kinase|nr:type III pantothenate kinase [Provencibacterium sp.]
MLLAIDIGNTNIEFGVYDGEQILARFRLGTNRDITSDEIGLFLTQFFSINAISREQIEDIIISTVVPQVMYSVQNAMKKYVGRAPLVVGENIRCPIENRYDNPREVGADRLVNGVSAFARYGGPLIIVDFGTATTFDVLSKTGAYLGGAIYPGIKISMGALFEKTAKLPRVELVRVDSAIGRNTVGSVQAGAMFGYVGAVSGIVAQIQRELGDPARVIGTGGLAQLVGQQQPDLFYSIDRTLTLDGLRMIYDEYRSREKA